ncbi:MAG: GAF and ANTAR domain-containing protein [bacterium]
MTSRRPGDRGGDEPWPDSSPAGSAPTSEQPRAGGTDDIADLFLAAWSVTQDARTTEPELLPVHLARACLAVLPADGAGLSALNDDFRVPLGASDDTATLAERLQFTQGEGPCLDSARSQSVLVADTGRLERSWPAFTQELFAHTPYRAIMTLPLKIEQATYGAVDLYFTDAARVGEVSLADALTVTESVVEALAMARHIGATAVAEGYQEPDWLQGPAARDRTYVWVAMGMVMARDCVTAPDALALLRAYAYGHDTTLDDVAVGLITGTLDVRQLEA